MRVFIQFNAARAHGPNLAQFNNFSLNFVTFRKHSAQKLSKTIWTDPCGILILNELKRENVLIRASCYALPNQSPEMADPFWTQKNAKAMVHLSSGFCSSLPALRLAAF
jgi:hypothetical protein